jgi:predicted nucleic acid-binding protein
VNESEETLALLNQALVPLTHLVHGAATHPEDDAIISTALSAGANYLVTGDKPLQRIRTHRDLKVLSPREFLTLLHIEGLS